MCLEVTLEITGIKEKQLDKLSNAIEKQVPLWLCGEPGRKGQETFVRTISEPKMCGCTLLADGPVDWRVNHWTFKAGVVEQIALMVTKLSAKAHIVSFNAAWRGIDPQPESMVNIRLTDLVELIRANHIMPQRRYKISHAA